jgi:hypothetical protein
MKVESRRRTASDLRTFARFVPRVIPKGDKGKHGRKGPGRQGKPFEARARRARDSGARIIDKHDEE